MSLHVNGNTTTTFAPIDEGTYLGVCYMLVDLGLQVNEKFKNKREQVVIGWEIPDETIELDDGPHPRTMFSTYTASLNEGSNLRQDLAAWRGRDFTPEELADFDLRKIVGTSCLINVVHREYNGKTYANVQSIMALPKGMARGQLHDKPIIYDIDDDPPAMVDNLPKWIGERIKKSESYQERLNKPVEFKEIDESEGQLPF